MRQKFFDSTTVTVRAGSGGDGCISFRREKFVAHGGPNGGDGGRGADVVLEAGREVTDLSAFARKKSFVAPHGRPGSGASREGAKADALVLKVPIGTLIRDADSGQLLADLDAEKARFVVARGGRGGRGNGRLASAQDQAPHWAQPGQTGVERHLNLELRLIADVGLIGAPNAGKSSLLNQLTRARPTIAAHAFSTIVPQLGVAMAEGERRFVVADVPGLIGGAGQGRGLGREFLRHLTRTRLLVHLLDGAKTVDEIVADLDSVEAEVSGYSQALACRPGLLVLNKCDLPGVAVRARQLRRRLGTGRQLQLISALTGQGCVPLTDLIAQALQSAPPPPIEAVEPWLPTRRAEVGPPVLKVGDGHFNVVSAAAIKTASRIDLRSAEGFNRFQVMMDKLGIERALEEAGARSGDLVEIADRQFTYEP